VSRATRPARLGALALAAAALAGCEARIEQLTGAPPGARVEVDVDDDRVVLSRGAAVAVACYDVGTPCAGVRAESDDEAVVVARRAFQDDLDPNGVDGRAAREAIVVAGRREGEATVRLTWESGELEVRVVVEPR
jgi:hypothetical protein